MALYVICASEIIPLHDKTVNPILPGGGWQGQNAPTPVLSPPS